MDPNCSMNKGQVLIWTTDNKCLEKHFNEIMCKDMTKLKLNKIKVLYQGKKLINFN